MSDLSLSYGGDLAISATGDLLTVSGSDYTQQRVLRRLLTYPATYIWQLSYGAGLAQFIGKPVNANAITGAALAQMTLEPDVQQSPAPTVGTVTDNAGTVVTSITYVDANTGATQVLTLPAA